MTRWLVLVEAGISAILERETILKLAGDQKCFEWQVVSRVGALRGSDKESGWGIQLNALTVRELIAKLIAVGEMLAR